MKYLYIILSLLILNSCDLVKSEDETFQCEKNAPIQVSGADKCAFAHITKHQIGISNNSEHMEISFGYGTGNFKIDMTITSGRITTKTYTYPGEVSLWFPEINKSGSGTVTITSFDTVNGTISGQFDLKAEGASNYQAYTYQLNGMFNQVRF